MKNQMIIESDDSESSICGYKRSIFKTSIAWICYIFSGFILKLVISWVPRWYLFCEFIECGIGVHTELILCKDQYEEYWIHKIRTQLLDSESTCELSDNIYGNLGRNFTEKTPLAVDMESSKKSQTIVFFIHKKMKYVWNVDSLRFDRLEGLNGSLFNDINTSLPLNNDEVIRSRNIYGLNEIMVKITPLYILLFKEGLHPFYVFQICSCILWYLDEYQIYASCIIFMSAISLMIELYQIRKNQFSLSETITSSGGVLVYRRTEVNDHVNKDNLISIPMDAKYLVPGDIIELPKSHQVTTLHCDAILLTGTCIVNESMLTGESLPVTKVPLPSQQDQLDMVRHSRHILFCGTKLIQARNHPKEPITAVVARTGYLTAKGGLVRSILFPKPIDAKFQQDSMKLVLALALFACVGLIYTIVIMIQRHISPYKIAIRALDLITIVVPPSLPIAMTIGTVFAQSRLKKENIFCISPSTINTCGAINITCFDKTGTLTEDGLDLWGVLCNQPDGTLDSPVSQPHLLDNNKPAVECMAACHSLTKIEGELCGDPLDMKMFTSLGWTFHEVGDEIEHGVGEGRDDGDKVVDGGDQIGSTYQQSVPVVVRSGLPNHITQSQVEIGVLRQFPFSSSLQRMSVIAKVTNRTYFTIYCKGSPEVIIPLCRADTIPREFSRHLVDLTRYGYRVLALATRPLKTSYPKAMRLSRQNVEYELRFAGLLVMENRLKMNSKPVINELRSALIRPVMATGDNLLTALSVARDCGMVKEHERIVLVDASEMSGIELHYTDDLQIYDYRNHRNYQEPVQEIILDHSKASVLTVLEHRDFHLALSGRTWSIIRQHYPQALHKLVKKGTVYARFSPDQKAQLIEVLQSVGLYVLMCGDGANDCGALKTAHAGISLCEPVGLNDEKDNEKSSKGSGWGGGGSEATVASPFVSRSGDVSCVPILIKEGRCALSTSFGIFRFIAGYSFTQFVSVLILYWFTANLSDYQFLYIDLVIITSLSLTFSYCSASKKLSHQSPSIRLLSITMILSLISQWTINAIIQVIAFVFVSHQPWYYMPKNKGDDYIHNSYANMAIFVTSSVQYLILGVVFAKGHPFRSPIYKNYLYLFNLFILLLITLLIMFYPFQWLKSLMILVTFPSNKYIAGFICVLLLINLMLGQTVESLVDRIDSHGRSKQRKILLFDKITQQFLSNQQQHHQHHQGYDPWPGRIIMSNSVQDMRPEIFTDSVASLASVENQNVSNTGKKDNFQFGVSHLERHRSAQDMRPLQHGLSKMEIESVVTEEGNIDEDHT